jgi:hypothetical protein
MSTLIADITVNDSYQLDIWQDNASGTFYVMDTHLACYSGTCSCDEDSGCRKTTKGVGNLFMGEPISDPAWTIGQTCRWIHTGVPDFDYDWMYTGYVGTCDSETGKMQSANKGFYKHFLNFTWHELLNQNVKLLTFDITFPQE